MGWAPRYSKNVMERVADNRGLARTRCMISSPIHPVGTWLMVYGPNTHTLLRCKVVDVSAPKDKARHIRTRRVAELSYPAAQAICGARHMADPPTSCPVLVWEAK